MGVLEKNQGGGDQGSVLRDKLTFRGQQERVGLTRGWRTAVLAGGRLLGDSQHEVPHRERKLAVSDMNGPKNYAPGSPSGRNGAATTRLVQNNQIGAFLGLGDFQYDTAYCVD